MKNRSENAVYFQLLYYTICYYFFFFLQDKYIVRTLLWSARGIQGVGEVNEMSETAKTFKFTFK